MPLAPIRAAQRAGVRSHFLDGTTVVVTGGNRTANASSAAPPTEPGSTRANIAGSSRLVFDAVAGGIAIQSLPFELSTLLDWTGYTQRVTPTASVGFPAKSRPTIAEPSADETAIEAPYRLFVSPSEAADWSHAADLMTSGTVTELWHTRLGVRANVESAVRKPGGVTFSVQAMAASLPVGATITVAGLNPTGYNGQFRVLASTHTSVTVALPTNPGAFQIGGQLATSTVTAPITGRGMVVRGGGDRHTDDRRDRAGAAAGAGTGNSRHRSHAGRLQRRVYR